MIVGDSFNPFVFTFNPGDGGGGSDDGDLAYEGTPEWDDNEDGVLDNYNDYENNGTITAIVSVDGITNYSAEGDMIAAFVDDEQRGVAQALEIPFGSYAEGFAFLMLIYSNEANGENILFRFYDIETDTIYDVSESVEFISDMTLGNVVDPEILNLSESPSSTPKHTPKHDAAHTQAHP